MANMLKTRLMELTENNEDLDVLRAQWAFDEKLVKKSLGTVSNLFPHFSLHDASHSKQILINIERLLGEESVALLSATDIWLLLESAYWHDIGMVVPHADQLTAEQSADFSDLIENIKHDPAHDLHDFCQKFDLTELKPWLKVDLPLADFQQRYNELMAEYFRTKHAARSSEIVLNPIDSIGLHSPRNTLIPNRLFSTLSQICLLHGSDFSEIEALLPHKINGVGNNDCHPRFIACMLRLGDLLDIDDNRFCPTLQLICGEGRPALSKIHEKKHAAIQDFSISPLEINIKAVCEDVDTYYETYQWFNWLEDEHKEQLLNWSSISPDEKRITLPSKCSASVKISGDQIILNANQKQEFHINGNEALYLLGDLLYKDPLLCMREIIQNAIDATAIRAWIGINDKALYQSRDNFSAAYKIFNSDELNKYPITITVQKNDNFEVMIEDRGTGVNRNDIHHLLQVASSKNNKRKNTIIKTMPDWMRPSGNFGVGFQSIFNVTDAVEITTKCFYTNERLRIKAFNPRGAKKGKVIITGLPAAHGEQSGSTVKFSINDDIIKKIGVRTKYSTENEFDEARNDFLSNALSRLDPFRDDGDTYKHFNTAAELIGLNHEIASNLHFKLLGHREIKSTAFSGQPFSTESGQHFEIKLSPATFNPKVSIRYRGAPVGTLSLGDMLISVEINILCGGAREWVTPDRNQLKREKITHLKDVIIEFIKEHPEHLFQPPENGTEAASEKRRFAASLALDHLNLIESAGMHYTLKKLSPEQREAYLEYEIEINKGTKKISEIISADELILTSVMGLEINHLKLENTKNTIIVSSGVKHNIGLYLQNKLLELNFYARRLFSDHPNLKGAEILYFKKQQCAQEIANYLSDNFTSNLIHIEKTRILFACIAISPDDEIFKNLKISRIRDIRGDLTKKIPLLNIIDLDIYGDAEIKWVVLPYIFRRGLMASTPGRIDTVDSNKLAETIQEFLDDQTLSVPDIATCYQNLITHIDDLMLKSNHAIDWQKLRAESIST